MPEMLTLRFFCHMRYRHAFHAQARARHRRRRAIYRQRGRRRNAAIYAARMQPTPQEIPRFDCCALFQQDAPFLRCRRSQRFACPESSREVPGAATPVMHVTRASIFHALRDASAAMSRRRAADDYHPFERMMSRVAIFCLPSHR